MVHAFYSLEHKSRSGITGLRGRLCCLPKWLYHIAFPLATYERSSCSPSSPVLDIIKFVYLFSHSNRGSGYLIMVLICSFWMTNSFLASFMHIASKSISSLVKVLPRSFAPILLGSLFSYYWVVRKRSVFNMVKMKSFLES